MNMVLTGRLHPDIVEYKIFMFDFKSKSGVLLAYFIP